MLSSSFTFILLTTIFSAVLVFDLPALAIRHLPFLAKQYLSLQEERLPMGIDIYQLDLLQIKPRFCRQHTDCTLKACLETDNCRLIAVNQDYPTLYPEEFAKNFACPQVSDQLDACADYARLNAFAACENGQCILKTVRLR
jgi:hypothetical protein